MENENLSGWYVYLLRCNDGKIYTGCASNLILRLVEHKNGKVHFTKYRLPVKLVNFTFFVEKYKAFEFERYLKSGSGKAFAVKRLIN